MICSWQRPKSLCRRFKDDIRWIW